MSDLCAIFEKFEFKDSRYFLKNFTHRSHYLDDLGGFLSKLHWFARQEVIFELVASVSSREFFR